MMLVFVMLLVNSVVKMTTTLKLINTACKKD